MPDTIDPYTHSAAEILARHIWKRFHYDARIKINLKGMKEPLILQFIDLLITGKVGVRRYTSQAQAYLSLQRPSNYSEVFPWK